MWRCLLRFPVGFYTCNDDAHDDACGATTNCFAAAATPSGATSAIVCWLLINGEALLAL